MPWRSSLERRPQRAEDISPSAPGPPVHRVQDSAAKSGVLPVIRFRYRRSRAANRGSPAAESVAELRDCLRCGNQQSEAQPQHWNQLSQPLQNVRTAFRESPRPFRGLPVAAVADLIGCVIQHGPEPKSELPFPSGISGKACSMGLADPTFQETLPRFGERPGADGRSIRLTVEMEGF